MEVKYRNVTPDSKEKECMFLMFFMNLQNYYMEKKRKLGLEIRIKFSNSHMANTREY